MPNGRGRRAEIGMMGERGHATKNEYARQNHDSISTYNIAVMGANHLRNLTLAGDGSSSLG
jgi:hypothetical protein